MLHNLGFFAPQNATYFIMLSFLIHKILMFYIKNEQKFKRPAPAAKGLMRSVLYFANCFV
jgi:hypothetical protein